MNVNFYHYEKIAYWSYKTISYLLIGGLMLTLHQSLTAQVFLNEISPDSGQSDRNNDAIVEIKNFGAATIDIGCMVLSNSEWIVVIPDGTTLAAGEVYLIACADSNNDSGNHNAGINANHGLACDECDFPVLNSIDLDVCEANNNDYFSTSTGGLTLDNQSATDGDQVVLFDTDGSILDAVYWGTDGGSSGSPDNASISNNIAHTLGSPYTRGSGAIEPNQVLPNQVAACNAASATSTNAGVDATFTFTMPGDGSAEYTDITSVAFSGDGKASRKGCNTSYVRTPTGNTRTSTSWTYTHHPTPGFDNGALAGIGDRPNGTGVPGDPADGYTFFIDIGSGFVDVAALNSNTLIMCSPGSVDFRITVENFQHVETRTSIEIGTNTTATEANPPSYPAITTKIGSYFRDDDNNIETAWSFTPATGLPNPTTGITQMDTNPIALLNGDSRTFILQWKDYALCCGSGAGTSNRASDQECYENVILNVRVEEAITSVDETEISCTGATPGQVNASTQVTDGSDVRYELFFNGTSQGINATGVFNVPTGAATPITIEVTDNSNCNTNTFTIPINTDCIAAPPCPDISSSEIDDCNP